MGSLPTRKAGRVLWVGSAKNGALSGLVKDMNFAFEKIGIESEKRFFWAHLTLIRIKEPQNLTQYVYKQIKPIKKVIEHVVLYESSLSPKGAQYRALKKFYLKSA